jgi:hypothetical protein
MSEYRIRIEQDMDNDSPRDEYENMGTMVCWHSRYQLGDEQPKTRDPSEYREELPEGTITLPLYLMDHSGISMRTSGFSCPWDSGQVGFIYVTLEDVRKEYGDDSKESQDKAIKYLEGEVETYDAFIRGRVYGYTLEKLVTCECCDHVEPEHVDSCWGFYDLDGKGNSAADSMREHIDPEHHALLDKVWNGGMIG